MVSLIFAAYIEESAKHLSSIGLLGKDFSFTQKDVILMTIFVVLGFTFAENMLYLIRGTWGGGEWVFRSVFTIFAHIFLSTLCSYFWWRALSEKMFSLRYFTFFLI
jgi:RsiW-degrading membrane proteinase PrsW (M82 family)